MATTTLQSAVRHYRRQQRLVAIALAQAQKAWNTRRYSVLYALMVYLQYQAAQNAVQAVEEMLEEQAIDAPSEAFVILDAMLGQTAAGANLNNLLDAAKTLPSLEMAVQTELNDMARVIQQMALTAKPDLEGYVRYLNPPSCSRCTVLAGRFYMWVDDFQRHENCDCFMVPVEKQVDADDLFTDPMEAYRRGLITDLTQAERAAIEEGVDIAAVINVRRRQAGLRVAGRVLERRGRLTPEGIYALSSDRQQVIDLLISNGYLSARG